MLGARTERLFEWRQLQMQAFLRDCVASDCYRLDGSQIATPNPLLLE